MASTENTLLGIALQSVKGTPITDDAKFHYLLFNTSSIAPSNVVLPTDAEVGGGAMLRDAKKVGVMSGGALEFIPRPATLGYFLLGALGSVVSATDGANGAFKHIFKLGTDQFAAPYFTVRSAPGNLWGEQFQDMRASALSLIFKGSDFLRAQVALSGGLPTKVATTTWGTPSLNLDSGPQFIAPLAAIELPTATPAKVLSGSFVAGMAIPLDQQWIVGSYSPDDFDIISRAFSLSLTLKVVDATLYSKMMYDPAGGSAWLASMLREANFKLSLVSDSLADSISTPTKPFSLSIAANGQSGNNANVIWSASPIGIRANKQVVMSVTGLFLASPTSDAPIALTLENTTTSYAS